MTSGWGVDATVSAGGIVTSGTTSADVRKVWGGLYTPGIISGCQITRSATAMQYTVSSGVAAIPGATGEIYMAPVNQTTVTVAPAPGTGTRVDVIYAVQRIPSSGDSNVAVSAVSFDTESAVSLPANALELDRYQTSAGQISTNASVRLGDSTYSIPYGGTLGTLAYYNNTYNGPLSVNLLREGYRTFDLPSDRRVRFQYSVVLSAADAYGFDNSKYCEYGYLFNSDRVAGSGDFILHTTPGLHQAWATYQFESTLNLPAGRNTVHIAGLRIVGPGQAYQHSGTDGSGFGRRGGEFIVDDLGPAI